MKKGSEYSIILYYYFHPIEECESFCREHKDTCARWNLLGRVYVASEGINGTLAGRIGDVGKYKQYLRSLKGFEKTKFKEDRCASIPFRKLVVKTRPEIVTLKADDPVDPASEPGKRLSPRQWRKVLESDESYVLIDARNDYESAIGHFQGALLPAVKNFYDFPQWVDRAGIDKKAKVLMYCTGGIRCEKLSVLMKQKGYSNVYQLDGGIIHYGQKQSGARFKGKCFVFDDRLAVSVNPQEREPIARCAVTGFPCDTYINCANPDCNKLFICSRQGVLKMKGCCSSICLRSPRKRPINEDNIFAPSEKWYRYVQSSVSI